MELTGKQPLHFTDFTVHSGRSSAVPYCLLRKLTPMRTIYFRSKLNLSKLMKQQGISLLEKHLNSSRSRRALIGDTKKKITNGRSSLDSSNSSSARDRSYLSTVRQEMARQKQRIGDALTRLTDRDSNISSSLSKKRLKAVIKLHIPK